MEEVENVHKIKGREDPMVGLTVNIFFQAEGGIRDLVRSRELGEVYKRQAHANAAVAGKMPLPRTTNMMVRNTADRLSLIHI